MREETVIGRRSVCANVVAERARTVQSVCVSSDETGVPATTRYVAVGDSDVAYQVLGDGDADVMLFLGLPGHIELMRVDPDYKPLLDHLTAFSRVILCDRRLRASRGGSSR
jgi:hypothetical protein